MEEESERQDQAQGTGTRRKFLHFMGIAGALPAAAFLEGCASTTPYPSGSKGGIKLALKGGAHVAAKARDRPQWNPHTPIEQKVRWDFEYLLYKIEKTLSKRNSTTADVDTKWDQWVMVGGKKRFLGVNFQVQFCPATTGDRTRVGKIIVTGCMTRDRSEDTPIFNEYCDPDIHHIKRDMSGAQGDRFTYHVYSSSSSSLYYA